MLQRACPEQALLPLAEKDPTVYPEDVTLECDDLWFRYEKDSPDVVKGFSLKLRKGEFYAILGGNGAGKSTTLKVISGLRCAYRGDVRLQGKLGHLPQNPQTLFVKRTVREDLYEVFRGEKIPKEHQDAEVARIVELCGLREFLDRHPYDISGGEQQRTALAKVLLTNPKLLLLDEPTKGMDSFFKVTFGELLEKLQQDLYFTGMEQYQTFFYPEAASLCDYMGRNLFVVFDEANRIQEAQEYLEKERRQSFGELLLKGGALPGQARYFFELSELVALFESEPICPIKGRRCITYKTRSERRVFYGF